MTYVAHVSINNKSILNQILRAMKVTETFKKTISDHLDKVAVKDKKFAEKLKKESKNIDDCITYILNQVKASGCNGFADEEIFGMAMHYYDEDNIKPGSKVKANVVVNHSVELTEEEKEKAKQEAIQQMVNEEREKLKKKKTSKSAPVPTEAQTSLFD